MKRITKAQQRWLRLQEARYWMQHIDEIIRLAPKVDYPTEWASIIRMDGPSAEAIQERFNAAYPKA